MFKLKFTFALFPLNFFFILTLLKICKGFTLPPFILRECLTSSLVLFLLDENALCSITAFLSPPVSLFFSIRQSLISIVFVHSLCGDNKELLYHKKDTIKNPKNKNDTQHSYFRC